MNENQWIVALCIGGVIALLGYCLFIDVVSKTKEVKVYKPLYESVEVPKELTIMGVVQTERKGIWQEQSK